MIQLKVQDRILDVRETDKAYFLLIIIVIVWSDRPGECSPKKNCYR